MPTQEEMTILLKARDQAQAVIEKSRGQMEKYGKAIKGIGIGMAAAGAGVEALARKQAPLLESTKKLAIQTGLTEKEIRGMATSLSNATFPLDEALGLMNLASKAGLEGADALQEYANFWDMVGDATGASSQELAKSAAALAAVGIEAGQEAQLLAAFGLITQNTSGSVQDFLQFVERLAPEMGRANVSVNDAAVFMTALEKELGLTAKTARAEFKIALDEAIVAADGQAVSLQDVAASLGLTQEQMQKYRDELVNSEGVIQANADAHASTKTTLEGLQSQFGDVMFTMGPFIQQAAGIAPIFLTAGPIMAAFGPITATSMTIARTAIRLTRIAVMTAMGPAGLIILAITAVIAIGVLLWKNWDTIKSKAISIFRAIADFFVGIWDRIVGIFRDNWRLILTILFPSVGLVLLIQRNWGAIVGVVTGIWDQVKAVVQRAIDFIMAKIDQVMGVINKVKGAADTITGVVGGVLGKINPFAAGGDIAAGQVALVGEKRPELFVPRTAGTIIPSVAGLGGGSGVVIQGPLVQVSGSILGTDVEDLIDDAITAIERRTGFTLRSR